jgi:hypothetical protein
VCPSRDLTLESLAAEVASLKRTVSRCYVCAKGIMDRYGWSPRTFYRRRRDPRFPRPHRFPGHLWLLADLQAAEAAGVLPDSPDSPDRQPDSLSGHG